MNFAPISSAHVHAELAQHQTFRQRLLTELPDLDEETLADTLEGLTDLNELLIAVTRSALEDEAIYEGLSTRLADMKARLERLGIRAKRKRELVREAMIEARLTKLLASDFAATLRQSPPGVDVVAEDLIPPAYWKPQPPKLDKLGILAALKSGTQIEGAVMAAPKLQLNVRTK